MTANWTSFLNKTKNLLCPPGDGVYTVHTAQDLKLKLQKKLYGSQDTNKAWASSLSQLKTNTKPCILGIASDNGGGILRGANWGPLFLREKIYQKFSQKSLFDLGDVRVIPQLLHDSYVSNSIKKQARLALYNNATSKLPVAPLSIAEEFLQDYFSMTHVPLLTLGGDHSISYPVVKTCLQAQKKLKQNTGVLHFDAHTDLLEERLGIPICFGSWTYHILQYLTDSKNLLQVGIRSTGKSKSHWEKKYGIRQLWAKEIASKGSDFMTDTILRWIEKQKLDNIYISFDIDAIDSKFAMATGTPEPDGLNPHDVLETLNKVLPNIKIVGTDLVEVAPFINHTSKSTEPKSTLKVAQDLLTTFINQF